MVKTYVLYCDALKDKSLFEKYYKVMPNARREKIDSFLPDVDKRLSLGVGILIKKYVGSEDEMHLGDNEKPLYDRAFFNVAHSGEVAMLTTADTEIDSVSGASTTSGAVVNAVNAGLDFYRTIFAGGGN